MEEKKQMELQVQADEATLSGRYSTMAQVTHTAEEFWIDFFASFYRILLSQNCLPGSLFHRHTPKDSAKQYLKTLQNMRPVLGTLRRIRHPFLR